ncbi:uncharacterized protein LOC112468673 [Temnothorax curvispinosus]|uniref:Uncharacterized protein LOC112468673 n=1 Tax=Temnothorax curvispinosus TaxID=300111 RepID=A0A6J1RM64_9HYME|nr:uncharacterized protein LOC112468673 [Temnothorax curvispinosus]
MHKKVNSTGAVQQQFINMLQRNSTVRPQGRRYTVQEKVFCIGIYKRSHACYNFLSKYLTCPTITTLNSELARIPLKTGCTKLIVTFLKNAVRDMKDDREKYVALLWDEISLQPGYGFCERSTKTFQLVRCIKKWLSHIINSGLIPIATICDQSGPNIAAINALIQHNNTG